MQKPKRLRKSRYATVVMAFPLAVAGMTVASTPADALPLVSGITQTTTAKISKAEKLNSTTIEITYADGKMLTVDFYGENIFRLFRDDNGGVIRDPQATPAAKILVDNARR